MVLGLKFRELFRNGKKFRDITSIYYVIGIT